MSDVAINPPHYRDDKRGECIDALSDHFREWLKALGFVYSTRIVTFMMLGFCVGNAFKYRWRAGAKDGESAERDEGKARWYDQFARHLAIPGEPDPRSLR